MAASNLERMKCMQQLQDSLTSNESWGELTKPLDKSVEIFRALHSLIQSVPDLKGSETLDQNIRRIFRHTILVIDNIAQLHASDKNNSSEIAQSLRCGLVSFLPELEDAEDLCSLRELRDLQADSSNERELVLHLRAVTNFISKINEILLFFKTIFCGFHRSSLFMWAFSEVLSRLEKTIPKLEATTVTAQKSEYLLSSALFSSLDRPLKIAMNALRLLFTFPTIKHAEFHVISVLCKHAVQIFVCATVIVTDLTQFFLKSFSNFKELSDRLAQHILAVHECCSEISASKVNVPQNLSNGRETGANVSQEFSAPNSQNEIGTSNESAVQNTLFVPITEKVCDTKASDAITSKELSKNVSVSVPQAEEDGANISHESLNNAFHLERVCSTEAFGVSTSQESSKNTYCCPVPQNVRNCEADGVNILQESSRNAVLIPQSLRSNEVISVDKKIIVPSMSNSKTDMVDSSVNTQSAAKLLNSFQNRAITKDNLTTSSKNVYNDPIFPCMSNSKTDTVDSSVNSQNIVNLCQDRTKEIPPAVAFSESSNETNFNAEMAVLTAYATNPALVSSVESSPCPGISNDEFKSLPLDKRQLLKELAEKSKYHLNFLSFSVKTTKLEVEALCKICNKPVSLESIEEHKNEPRHVSNLFDKCRTNSKTTSILNESYATSFFVNIRDIKLDSVVANQKRILQELRGKLQWHADYFSFLVKPVEAENQENSESESAVSEYETVTLDRQTAGSDLLVKCKICNETLLAENVEMHIQDTNHHRNIFDNCKASPEARAAVPDIKEENWQFLKIKSDTQYECRLCSTLFGSSVTAWVLHFHSFVHRAAFKEWRSQSEESRDLAGSAHFFRDSLAATFASLEKSQQDRVNALIDNLKDAMNFFSIEKKGKLSFFCHVCKESVVSRKVPDHVGCKDHLRGLTRNGQQILKRSVERNNNLENPAKSRKHDEYSNGSSSPGSIQSPQKVRKRSRSSSNRSSERGKSLREKLRDWTPSSQDDSENSPRPKIRRRHRSSSPPKDYVRNICLESPEGQRRSSDRQSPDGHDSTNSQSSPPSAQAVAAVPESSNTAEMLVAKLQHFSSICAASLAPYLKSKASSPSSAQDSVTAPEVSNSNEPNILNTEKTAENNGSSLQSSSSTSTKVGSSSCLEQCTKSCSEPTAKDRAKICIKPTMTSEPTTKDCGEVCLKPTTTTSKLTAKNRTEVGIKPKMTSESPAKVCAEVSIKPPPTSEPPVQKISVVTGMRKSHVPNIAQNPVRNTAESFFNLRSSSNIRARVASYIKSKASSQPIVQNVVPVQKCLNTNEQIIGQSVAYTTKPSVVQKFSKNTSRNFRPNLQICSSNRAKVAFALKPQVSSRPNAQSNVAVAESLITSKQNAAPSTQNTAPSTLHSTALSLSQNNPPRQSSLQNTAESSDNSSPSLPINTARKLAQNPSQKIAQNAASREANNRVFDKLLPEDKRVVRDIESKIKDEMNNFMLSHNPRTSELRMLCKLCQCSVHPEEVIIHISEPWHVEHLADLDGDFCKVLEGSS